MEQTKFIDKMKKKSSAMIAQSKDIHEETAHVYMSGEWMDEIYKKDENGNEYLYYKSDWNKNKIVINAGFVISSFFKGGTNTLYHAIGQGAVSWDTSLPSPSIFDTALFSEIYRQIPNSTQFVKVGTGQAASGTITTLIDNRRVVSNVLVGRVEPDDYYNGMILNITAGTNSGLFRTITDYTQSNGEFLFSSAFPSAIDSTSVYSITKVAVTSITNSVELQTILDFGTGSSPFNYKDIREQAIFGANATAASGSGLMVNRITHPKIYKDPTIKLVRTIRLIFKI